MIKVGVDSVRVDRFISQVLQRSWGSSQKLIREGFIRMDGKKIKDVNYRLRRDDMVEIRCFTVPV